MQCQIIKDYTCRRKALTGIGFYEALDHLTKIIRYPAHAQWLQLNLGMTAVPFPDIIERLEGIGKLSSQQIVAHDAEGVEIAAAVGDRIW